MITNTLWLAAALAASASAAVTPPPEITAAPHVRRDQSPIMDDLGNPDDYALTDLGPDNSVIVYEGNTYRYIEAHTGYLSIETITTTNDAGPTQTTSEIKVSVATAAAGAPDQSVGDIALTFSQDIADALGSESSNAIAACGVPKSRKMVKRVDFVQCMVDRAIELTNGDGPLKNVADDKFWEELTITLAADANEYLVNAIAVLASQAAKNKALVILAGLVAGYKIGGAIATINLPKAGVGNVESTDDNSTCDKTKKADENSPLCESSDCSGVDEKCTQGSESGCACAVVSNARMDGFDQAWSDEQQKIIDDHINDEEQPEPAPECDTNDASTVPWNVFSDGVYKGFCDKIAGDKNTALSQVVDSKGNVIPPKRRRSILGRTPPPDPDAFEGFTFALDWSGGDGSCDSDCATSYYTIAQSPCGHTAGEQNIMASEGKLDTGCGIYSWKISKPPGSDPPPAPAEIKRGDLYCFTDPKDIKCWKDVHGDKVNETASEISKWFGGLQNNDFTSTTANITQVLRDGGESGKGVTYMMNIGWIPGCEGPTQKVDLPVPNDDSVKYDDLLKNPYYECKDNNGLGGRYDVGCLRYGFYPNNAGTFGSPPHPEKFFDTMSYCG